MYSNNDISEIYVRLIDGVLTLVPCKARQIDLHSFEIAMNDYLDMENDFTSIWQFFPGDVVECEEKNGILVANRLLSSTLKNREALKMIFDLVARHGTILTNERVEISEEGVNQLCCNRKEIIFAKHPVVSNWLDKHCNQPT